MAIYTAYAASTGQTWDISQAAVVTGTFALAGFLIGTGVGAAAGTVAIANATEFAVAASAVGSGVAGGGYGYLAQSAFRGTDFDSSSFSVASAGAAIDSGLAAAIPNAPGRQLASGLTSGIQAGIDAGLHGKRYSGEDFLDNFAGGVLARTGLEATGQTPRYLLDIPDYVKLDPEFARSTVARQEVFFGGYEAFRSTGISSDNMRVPFQWFRQRVVEVGNWIRQQL